MLPGEVVRALILLGAAAGAVAILTMTVLFLLGSYLVDWIRARRARRRMAEQLRQRRHDAYVVLSSGPVVSPPRSGRRARVHAGDRATAGDSGP